MSKNPKAVRLKSGSLHRCRTSVGIYIPVIEGAGGGIAANGNVLANDFALFPFLIVGIDLRD